MSRKKVLTHRKTVVYFTIEPTPKGGSLVSKYMNGEFVELRHSHQSVTRMIDFIKEELVFYAKNPLTMRSAQPALAQAA